MADRLCVGVVVGAHGVRGQVRIKSFTADPADLTRYGPLETEQGARWRLKGAAVGTKGVVTASVEGILDRNQAEAAKGTRLFVRREALPAPEEEEFYVADLIGLAAESVDGRTLGKVKAVFDFGAGDVLEIEGPEGGLMLPFTRRTVPLVDLAGKKLVVDPPLPAEEVEEEKAPHAE
jgi:16S rRNA processing protein RimM